ncbi:MAG: hypothetical protein ACREDP_06750, partial [Bradyrhizobium sp.]
MTTAETFAALSLTWKPPGALIRGAARRRGRISEPTLWEEFGNFAGSQGFGRNSWAGTAFPSANSCLADP